MVASISKHDWESYRAVGRVPPSIREVVLRSWQRSSQLGVTTLKHAPLLHQDELDAMRNQSRRLRNAAHKALSKADYLLQQTGNMLLLCSPEGIVLDAVGDHGVLARGRENHLDLGGEWSEAAIGTNAIGTAIHMGRSVQVNGHEHYNEEIQRWSCAASPIKDPGTGQLIGILDISWPSALRQQGCTTLSSAFALQVESELGHQLAEERHAILQHLHRHPALKDFIALDRSGHEIFASEGFERFLESPSALTELRVALPSMIAQGPQSLAEALSDYIPGATLSVVEAQAEAIGIVVTPKPRRLGRSAAKVDLSKIATISPRMAEIVAQAERLLQTDLPVLIEGEIGTGKAFLAQAMHDASRQRDSAFSLLECSLFSAATLRQYLADDRLFGRHGTLCLDSPGLASHEVQKLLVSVVEKAERGGNRIITLVSQPLFPLLREGKFDNDLYYQIAGARLTIPPLRERPDEIAAYLHELLRRNRVDLGGRELRFTAGAIELMQKYAWPGNLREMDNLISSLGALSLNSLFDERSLPAEMRGNQIATGAGSERLRDIEKSEILAAIDASSGNLTDAARRLGIARSTLYLKLDSYRIERPRRA